MLRSSCLEIVLAMTEIVRLDPRMFADFMLGRSCIKIVLAMEDMTVRLDIRLFAARRNRDAWEIRESVRVLGFCYMEDSDIAYSFVLSLVFATL